MGGTEQALSTYLLNKEMPPVPLASQVLLTPRSEVGAGLPHLRVVCMVQPRKAAKGLGGARKLGSAPSSASTHWGPCTLEPQFLHR